MVTVSTYFLKPVLLLHLPSIFFFFGEIYPVLIKNPLFLLTFFVKKIEEPKKISKIAIESGLLGPKIFL